MSNVRKRTPKSQQHGATWDEGTLLRATAREEPILDEEGNATGETKTIATTVQNPRQGPPKRVVSGQGDVRLMPNGSLEIRNHGRTAGEEISIVVEY